MNLIEILNNNGTGLLQGLCRTKSGDGFEGIVSEEQYRDTNGDLKNFPISFSLNEKNLGVFSCEPQHNGGNRTLTVKLVDHEVWIEIQWPDDDEFGFFKATLSIG